MEAEIKVKISRNADGEYIAEAKTGWSIPKICFELDMVQSENDSALLTIILSPCTSTTTTTMKLLPDGRYEIGPPKRE